MNIGNQLKNTRSVRGISLIQASKHTGIDIKFLYALEQNNASIFGSYLYYKSFLNKYLEYLEIEITEELKEKSYRQTNKRYSVVYDGKFPRFSLKIILFLTIVLSIISYFVFQLYAPFSTYPQITFTKPFNETIINNDKSDREISRTYVSDSPEIDLMGNIDKLDTLIINGRKIYPDGTGDFLIRNKLLSPGSNILEINIKNIIGQTTNIKLTIIYNP